jgi:hypothetical protein
MNYEIAQQWVAALRSGEYAQEKSRLKSDNGYCCLGVLCDLYTKQNPYVKWKSLESVTAYFILEHSLVLPCEVKEWARMKSECGQFIEEGMFLRLDKMNDDGHSFNEIADVIEKVWERL